MKTSVNAENLLLNACLRVRDKSDKMNTSKI